MNFMNALLGEVPVARPIANRLGITEQAAVIAVCAVRTHQRPGMSAQQISDASHVRLSVVEVVLDELAKAEATK